MKRIPKLKNSVLISWLVSYIFILAIPVIINGFMYMQATNMLRTEIKQSYTFTVERMQQKLDALLSDMTKIQVDLSANPRINEFLTAKTIEDINTRYASHRVIEDISRYRVGNPFIDEIYIYFNNVDRVLNSVTSNTPNEFFQMKYAGTSTTREEWDKIISSRSGPAFSSIEMIFDEKKIETLTFVASIPITSPRSTTATLFISIDKEKLLDLIFENLIPEGGNVFIIDSSNNILLSDSSDNWQNELLYDDFPNSYDNIYKSLGGGKYMVSYASSGVTEWKYIITLMDDVFWQKSHYLRNFMVSCVFLCIMLGLAGVWFVTKKNYSPVRELTELLKKKTQSGNVSADLENEYSFIQSMIDKLSDEKETMSNKLYQQNNTLRYNFLSKLLKGTAGNYNNLISDELLKSYGIEFKGDLFAVILFYIEDAGIFADGEKAGNSLTISKFVISNVFEELINKAANGYMTEADDMLACIVNISSEMKTPKEEFTEICEYAKAFIQDNFQIKFSVAISDIHRTLIGIPSAYQKAIDALEYRILLGSEQVIVYEDIVKMPEGSYYYPLEKEQQLINYIKTGNFENSKQILDEIFAHNFDKTPLSVQETKCLMFDLVSTIIKTANDININHGRELIEELNPFERLLKNDNILTLKEEITKILESYCRYLSANSYEESAKRIRDRVIEYVKLNHADINLSVTSIADELKIHQSYLSKIFKEQIGEGLLDYIHKIRISEAKKLLLNTDLNMEAIASKTGYSNIRTFMRTFKKYEGITPGTYRSEGFELE